MPTAETLKSLIGLLETGPEENNFEFIVEPNGDLVRSISVDDETNFYMENETLPLDFNDIFEINRVPSSFHGKIQATLGSIFQDCLIQDIGVQDKDILSSDTHEVLAAFTEIDVDEPTSKLKVDEIGKTDIGYQTVEFKFKTEQAKTDIQEACLKLEGTSELNGVEDKSMDEVNFEHDVIGCLDVFQSDDTNMRGEVGESIDFEFLEVGSNLSVLENTSEFEDVSALKKAKPKVEPAYRPASNEVEEDHLSQLVEVNAWKCRLYRARRKRKLEKISSELEILETENKRLKLRHEKMLSNIQLMREFYIKSIQQGTFHIKL